MQVECRKQRVFKGGWCETRLAWVCLPAVDSEFDELGALGHHGKF